MLGARIGLGHGTTRMARPPPAASAPAHERKRIRNSIRCTIAGISSTSRATERAPGPGDGGIAASAQAVAIAREEGLNVKMLVPYLVYPVAEGVYRDFFATVQRGLVVEQSHLGQFYRVLRMYVDLPKGVESMARSGANPFRPREIVAVLHRLLAELQHIQAGNLQPQE